MYIDEIKRKLRVPAKFLPYLEKYRLYVLFHELTCELIIKKPDDHVQFIYNVLIHAANSCDTRRLILIAAPFVNLSEIVDKLTSKFNLKVITKKDIEKEMIKHKIKKEIPEKFIAKCVKRLLEKIHTDCGQGWLLLGYPETRLQAAQMQRQGILPTHVIHFVTKFTSPLKYFKNDYCTNMPDHWIEFRRNLIELREAFSSTWSDIGMNGRDVEEIVQVCSTIISSRRNLGEYKIPRICLIGFPDLKYMAIARNLSIRFQLININFSLLLEQAYLNNNLKFSEVKDLKHNLNMDSLEKSRIRSEVLFKKLLENQCVDKGWVLTEFPLTLNDMKRFDKMVTPPNRVIFLEYPDKKLSQLNLYKKGNTIINTENDEKNNILSGPYFEYTCTCDISKVDTQMENNYEVDVVPNAKLTEAELTGIEHNLEEIRTYCGKTAFYVNADQPFDDVLNCVFSIILKPLPDVLPRNSIPKELCEYKSYEYPKSDKLCPYQYPIHDA